MSGKALDLHLADTGTDTDPGETLLGLVSQARRRAGVYAAELERQVANEGLQGALVGDSLVIDPRSGRATKVAEYVRGLATLEAQERDRAAKFAKLAVDAGISERRTVLAERQGQMITAVLMAAFAELALTDAQRALAPQAIRRALEAAQPEEPETGATGGKNGTTSGATGANAPARVTRLR